MKIHKANGMLAELTAGGHLMAESKDGSLFYSLAGSSEPDDRAVARLTTARDTQPTLDSRSRCERRLS